MLIKTLTWHSLTYIVGITSSMAVHQVSPGTASRSHLEIGPTAVVTGQIANRLVKGDRLPAKQVKHQVKSNVPVQVPSQATPNPKPKTDCKPPIDVIGRCFADARANQKIA